MSFGGVEGGFCYLRIEPGYAYDKLSYRSPGCSFILNERHMRVVRVRTKSQSRDLLLVVGESFVK